jgi:SPP1 family predicted phage head-tail adaptor
MRAGQLRHRVAIEAPAEEPDDVGDVRTTWAAIPSSAPDGLWAAEVKPLAGREAVVVRQLRAEATHAVTLRYGAPATPRHRLIHRGRVLQVLSSLDVDERRRELALVCKEVLPGA